MEQRGWIHGQWVEKSGHRGRRDYRQTAQRRKVLVSQRDWKAFLEAIGRITGVETCVTGEKRFAGNWRTELARIREAEIPDELAQHAEDRYRELKGGGASEAEPAASRSTKSAATKCWPRNCARSSARTLWNPSCWVREEKGMPARVWQDLRYGFRTLRTNPASRRGDTGSMNPDDGMARAGGVAEAPDGSLYIARASTARSGGSSTAALHRS